MACMPGSPGCQRRCGHCRGHPRLRLALSDATAIILYRWHLHRTLQSPFSFETCIGFKPCDLISSAACWPQPCILQLPIYTGPLSPLFIATRNRHTFVHRQAPQTLIFPFINRNNSSCPQIGFNVSFLTASIPGSVFL
jgi:hypothetical protein